jgi:nucleoside-diphosphate-sugar epimerase
MTALRMDVTNPAALDNLPVGFDTVFYIVTPDTYEDAAYASAFVCGTENLLRALCSEGARPGRLIFVSSTSVYGQSQGEWVDEASPTDPRGCCRGRRPCSADPSPAPWCDSAVSTAEVKVVW